MVTVELKNKGKKKLDYFGSRALAARGMKLSDDLDAGYDAVTNILVEGQVRAKTPVYPGDEEKPVRDVLVFERPAKGIKHLKLALPGQSFGATGTHGLKISADTITSGDDKGGAKPEPEAKPKPGGGEEPAKDKPTKPAPEAKPKPKPGSWDLPLP
jgi:hypothetical protein